MNWKHTIRFCFTAFWMDFAAGMLIVALPYAVLRQGGDSFSLGSAAALRGLGYSSACLLLARLADRFNRKLLMAVSSAFVTAGLLLVASASSLGRIYAGILVWAVGLAPFWPSVFSWFGDSHPSEQFGRAGNAMNFSWSAGGLAGGLLSGLLFVHMGRIVFALAVIPVVISWLSLGLYACPHLRPAKVEKPKKVPGAGRMLAAALLANVSIASLAGLITNVFPEFGITLGVNSAVFGLLVAFSTLGRMAVFLAGMRLGEFLRKWRVVFTVQAMAALAVAGIGRISGMWWLAAVFIVVGAAGGACYYRGFHTVLELPGSRGMKTAIFEAMLLAGIMLGGFFGGWMANVYGLRSPYPAIAAFSMLLVLLQLLLVFPPRTPSTARGCQHPRETP